MKEYVIIWLVDKGFNQPFISGLGIIANTSMTFHLRLVRSGVHLPAMIICIQHTSYCNDLLQIFPWVGLLLVVVYFFYAVIGMQVSSVQSFECKKIASRNHCVLLGLINCTAWLGWILM